MATPALVQSNDASGNSGASATASFPAATTAGNLLVLLVSAAKNPGDVTFTPPAGWVQAGTTLHDDVFISVSTAVYLYPNNPGGITSVAITISSAVSAWHAYLMEFSGVATASPLDGTTAREQDHTTTPSSGPITTTAAGDLLIGWAEVDVVSAGEQSVTQPAGWTALPVLHDGGGWLATCPAYEVAGAAGSYNYQPTSSVSANEGVYTLVALLAASGGGGTPVSLTGQAGLMVLNPPAAATLTIAVALAGHSGTAVLIGASASLALAVALAAQSGKGVLTAPNATLAVAVALVSPSAALGVLTGSTATLSLGGQLVAQAGLMVLAPPPSPATLAVAVRLIAPAPAVAVLTPAAAAAVRLAVPLLPVAPALAVLAAPNATVTIIGLAFAALASLSDAAVAGAAVADTAIGGDTLSDALLASATIGDE